MLLWHSRPPAGLELPICLYELAMCLSSPILGKYFLEWSAHPASLSSAQVHSVIPSGSALCPPMPANCHEITLPERQLCPSPHAHTPTAHGVRSKHHRLLVSPSFPAPFPCCQTHSPEICFENLTPPPTLLLRLVPLSPTCQNPKSYREGVVGLA